MFVVLHLLGSSAEERLSALSCSMPLLLVEDVAIDGVEVDRTTVTVGLDTERHKDEAKRIERHRQSRPGRRRITRAPPDHRPDPA
jgi:hypothetical protein